MAPAPQTHSQEQDFWRGREDARSAWNSMLPPVPLADFAHLSRPVSNGTSSRKPSLTEPPASEPHCTDPGDGPDPRDTQQVKRHAGGRLREWVLPVSINT